MTEKIWSRLIILNRLNVEQYMNSLMGIFFFLLNRKISFGRVVNLHIQINEHRNTNSSDL